ncbi:MAG TPA: alkaline phosphatase family protein, partial [Candidatus Baltobacteraceae bacterium]|nr:alkaline phosphatase family protein [Candidatus Baltobacteraceae bacterium]
MRRWSTLALAATIAAASCAGPSTSANAPASTRAFSPATGSQYISHVVVMIQENRTFDNLFATFPDADGATQGKMKTASGYTFVPLQKTSLNYPCDFGHSYKG